MAEDFGLKIAVQATFEEFQRQMDEIGNLADQAATSIEGRFQAINPGFGGGLLAVGGGLVGAWGLDKALDIIVKMNTALAEMDDNARRVGLTIERFQAVQFVGNVGGASNSDVLETLTKMSSLLNDAGRNENSLTKILDENNIKYKDANGQLITTNQLLTIAGDILRRAQTPAEESVQAKLLGVTEKMIPVLRQSASEFENLATEAEKAGAVIDRETTERAKQFRSEWLKSSTEWSAYMQSALAGLIPYLDDLIGKAAEFIKTLNSGGALDKIKELAFKASVAAQISAQGPTNFIAQANEEELKYLQANLKSTGDAPDPVIESRLAKLRAPAAPTIAPGDFSVGPDPTAGIDTSYLTNPSKTPAKDTGSDPRDQWDRASDSIQKQTAVLRAHSLTVGEDTGKQQEAKAASVLLTAAVNAGYEIDDKAKGKIKELSQAYGDAALAAAVATQKFQQQNELLQFGGNQMISILDGIRTKSLTGAQAVAQLSNALITAIEKAVLLGQGPLAGIFGSAALPGTGGTGGLIGALFGGFKAGGGSVDAGKYYVTGEDGPELIRMGADGMVMPNKVLSQASSGNEAGPPIIIQADFRGAAPEAVASISQQLRQLQTVVQQMPQVIAGTQKLRPTLGRN